MFSMFAAEVFPGWTSVENEAPGLPRLSGARASRKTIANALEQQLRFEVRVRLRIFIVAAGFFGWTSVETEPRVSSGRWGGGASVGCQKTTTRRCNWVA